MMKINKKNILKYAKLYERDYKKKGKKTEKRMKSLLKNQRYLTLENLIAIGDWKAPRARRHYKKNGDRRVRKITRFSFGTRDEKERIESLDSLQGVGYPIASTILHFGFPRKYPIMDFRVIRSLGWKRHSTYNFQFWQRYCKRIRNISKKFGLPIRTVEKALWKYDKEKYSRSKKLTCTSRRNIKYHSST